jgi:hypothetical protein
MKGCSAPYIASAETFTSPTCAASSKILCAHVPHAKGTNRSTYTRQAFSFLSPFQQRSGRTLALILWRRCHEFTENRSSSRWWIASASPLNFCAAAMSSACPEHRLASALVSRATLSPFGPRWTARAPGTRVYGPDVWSFQSKNNLLFC